MKTCNHNNCNNPQFGGGYCRWHQYKRTDGKKPKPIDKAAARTTGAYQRKAKKFRNQNFICQANLKNCTIWATEVHHKKGRVGDLLNDERFFLAVCHNCHREIEENPAMARKRGFILSRHSKN